MKLTLIDGFPSELCNRSLLTVKTEKKYLGRSLPWYGRWQGDESDIDAGRRRTHELLHRQGHRLATAVRGTGNQGDGREVGGEPTEDRGHHQQGAATW